jgi:hypothetical protein
VLLKEENVIKFKFYVYVFQILIHLDLEFYIKNGLKLNIGVYRIVRLFLKFILKI